MQQPPVILDHLQRHIQLTRDPIRVTLADGFGARVLQGIDEPERGLASRPAFGLGPVWGAAADVVVSGVDELMAERAASLEIRQRLIQDDEQRRLVVDAAQTAGQAPLLDADADP